MHRLFAVFLQYEFSTKETCKLFNQLVLPELNYFSEILGLPTAKETIHNKFLHKILGVRRSTNFIGLYGEAGRVPLQIIRKIHMFRYGIKLLQLNDNSLVKQMYVYNANPRSRSRTHNNNQNQAFQIKSLLESLGLPILWLNQEHYTINLSQIKRRLFY